MSHPSLFDDAPPVEKPAASQRSGKPIARQPPEPFAEPLNLSPFPEFYRNDIASGLRSIVAEFEAGQATSDELYRYLRGASFVLSPAELVRLANWLADLLEECNGNLQQPD